VITVSGNSGRGGNRIRAHAPRNIPAALAQESRQSPFYDALCDRLGYAAADQDR